MEICVLVNQKTLFAFHFNFLALKLQMQHVYWSPSGVMYVNPYIPTRTSVGKLKGSFAVARLTVQLGHLVSDLVNCNSLNEWCHSWRLISVLIPAIIKHKLKLKQFVKKSDVVATSVWLSWVMLLLRNFSLWYVSWLKQGSHFRFIT